MARTINRNATPVRRQARSAGRAGQVRKARAQTSGLLDKVMNALPFTDEQWHRFFTVLILGTAAVVLIVILRLTGLWAIAEQQVAHVAANAGYKVENVRVIVGQSFRWKNERHPGPDDPSRADVVMVTDPIAPRGSIVITHTFPARPDRPDSRRTGSGDRVALNEVASTGPVEHRRPSRR